MREGSAQHPDPLPQLCKSSPQREEESFAKSHALKECVKECMADFWEQAVVRSKRELKEEQDSRAFWQNRVTIELEKTLRASSETKEEIARLQGQIQKLAPVAEQQQSLRQTSKLASPQQVQGFSQAPRRHQQVLQDATMATSQVMPPQPPGEQGITEQEQLSHTALQTALVRAVQTTTQQFVVESEERLADQLFEMQKLLLARLDAIKDDCHSDALLKLSQVGRQSEDSSRGNPSVDRSTCLPFNTGDPLIEFGKMSSDANVSVTPATPSTAKTSLPARSTVASSPKRKKRTSRAIMELERFAVRADTQNGHDDGGDSEMKDLLDDTSHETPSQTFLRFLNYVSFVVVLLNAIYMGIRVDANFRLIRQNKEEPLHLSMIEHMFTAIFCFEICIRLGVEKRQFFTGENARWNLFDASIVTIQLFEAMNIHNLSGTTAVRVLRIARILKTARALRTLKNLRILRLIMATDVWQPLIWSIGMLLAIMYLFAIFITTLVMDSSAANSNDLPERALELYGSVIKTQYTLFMAISGGEPWTELIKPLNAISAWIRWLFLVYMILLVLGVMNTVQAVYVDALLHFSSIDRDLVMTERNFQEKRSLKKLRELLHNQPGQIEGMVTEKDVMEVLSGDGAGLLKSLGLQVSAAKALFRLLDVEDMRAVEVDEFVYGLLHLKGNSTTIHMTTLMYQSKRLLSKMLNIQTLIEEKVLPLMLGADPNLLGLEGAAGSLRV